MLEYDGKVYLSPNEMGNILKVTGKTIRNWIESGYVHSFKIGGRYYIPESELHRLLKGD